MLITNKKLLKIVAMFFIIIAMFFLGNTVEATPQPTKEFYVNDYADVLSDETEQYIIEKSKELNEVDGTQIVVVTIDSLEGKALEEYSIELARKFEIGDKDKNNGVLLLLSIGDRQSRIEVGLGLEGILPDGKTGRIQDEYMIPYYADDNWNEGIINGYNAFYQEIVTGNGFDLGYDAPAFGGTVNKNAVPEEAIGISVALSIFLGILLGKEVSVSQRIKYANSTYFQDDKRIKNMISKYTGFESRKDVKGNILKIIIYTIILILITVVSVKLLGVLSIVCIIMFFAIAFYLQFPSSKLISSDDDDDDYTSRGSFGGGSFGGGGSSGGGGSFGGGGSSRDF